MLAVTASLLALAVGNHSFRHSKFRFADIMENRKNDLCLDGHSLPTVTESWCRGQVGDDESSLCLGVASILNATCAELLDEEFLQQVARRVGLVNDVRGARIYGAEAKHMRRASYDRFCLICFAFFRHMKHMTVRVIVLEVLVTGMHLCEKQILQRKTEFIWCAIKIRTL